MILVVHRSRPPRRRTSGLARGLGQGGRGVVEVSVEQPSSMRELRAVVAQHRPQVVVLAESWDDRSACQADPDRAYRENAEAAISLAAAALEFAARPVLLSTAEVYGQGPGPWSEADPPEPESAYASAMLRAEQFLARAAKHALIVRVSEIYGDGVFEEVERLGAGLGSSPSELVSPISAYELGRAVSALIDAEATGVFHGALPGPPASRAEVDQKILEWRGLPAAGLKAPKERRRGHALFGDRLRKVIALPSWDEALKGAARIEADPARAKGLAAEVERVPELATSEAARPVAGPGSEAAPSWTFARGVGYEAHLHTLASTARLPSRAVPRPTTLLVLEGKVLVELQGLNPTPTDHVLRARGTLLVPTGASFSALAAEPSLLLEIG